MSETIATGLATIVLDTAEQHYRLSRRALLDVARLEPEALRDPSGLVPRAAFEDLLRAVVRESGDPALGLRCAEAVDLRTQGFWGYALMASLTLRERLEVHARYLRLRGPFEMSLHTEGHWLAVCVGVHSVGEDLVPVIVDWGIGGSCLQLKRRASGRALPLEAWLTLREQPHHRELRAWVGGPVVFEAPETRLHIPESELDRPLDGDPYLGQLATAQLDATLARLSEGERRAFLDQVRERLSARLGGDTSLVRIAGDLRVSARTLQRQLAADGMSFQELLEEVRHARAVALLVESDASVEHIALRLGYGDPSNFRRAFRRWTGVAPAAYRAVHRARV